MEAKTKTPQAQEDDRSSGWLANYGLDGISHCCDGENNRKDMGSVRYTGFV